MLNLWNIKLIELEDEENQLGWAGDGGDGGEWWCWWGEWVGGGGYVTARRAEENQGSAAETHPMCRLPRTRLRAADK